jgi:hypothetical protein
MGVCPVENEVNQYAWIHIVIQAIDFADEWMIPITPLGYGMHEACHS